MEPDWEPVLDTVFWSGYSNTGGLPETIAVLEQVQAAEITRIRSHAVLRRSGIQAEIDALREQQRQEPLEEAGLQQSLQEVEREHLVASADASSARSALVTAFTRLLAERPSFDERALEQRVQAESRLVQATSVAVADADQARIASELRLLATELVRRSAGQPELDATESEARQSLEDARQALGQQARHMEQARRSGMTMRAAGFLVWAGYLGMAAFGWLLGSTLHARATAPDGTAGLIRFIADHAYRVFLGMGFLEALGWITGFAVVWLVFASALVLGYDWLLGRFDQEWKPQPPAERSRVRAQWGRAAWGKQPQDRAFDLSWDAVLKTLNGNVDRGDFRKHLARTPLLAIPAILGLLALLFFSRGGERLDSFSAPLDSLMYLVVGIAAAAAGTGLVSIIFTLWIAPALLDRRAAPTLRLPLAILGIFAVFWGWALAADLRWLPRGPWGQGSLGGPVLLIAANAVVLAIGLVYRNLHREWQRLEGEVAKREQYLATLRPHTLLTPRDFLPTALFTRWEKLYEKLDEAWRAQEREPDARLEAGTPPYRDPLLLATEVTKRDGLLAPVLTAAVIQARLAYVAARRRLKQLSRRRVSLLSRIAEIHSGELGRRLQALELEAGVVQAEADAAAAQAQARYLALQADARMAHRTGQALREREHAVRNDPVIRDLSL